MLNRIPKQNAIWAVVAGAAVTVIAGLLLFPILYLVFNSFFELHMFSEPPPNAWINDAVIMVTYFLWLLAASMAGGWACGFISKRKEYANTLFLVEAVVVALIVIYFRAENAQSDLLAMLGTTAVCAIGFFAGAALAVRRKKRTQPLI